jgi:predicted transposase/invertase (TIGR01784 family)
MPQAEKDRMAIIDISCITKNKETIIIELQREPQKYFVDRTIYYSTFPIMQQAEKGGTWGYKLNPVYMISILNFTLDNCNQDDIVHTVQLKTHRNEVFYDKLCYIYITVPAFNKTEEELETQQDKWLYIFKNLAMFNEIPQTLRKEEKIQHLFEKAQVAVMDKWEYAVYFAALKKQRDNYSILETAVEKGLQKGLEQGIEQGIQQGIEQGQLKEKLGVALALKKQSIDLQIIINSTGLTKQQIDEL